jgi:hypothetical protein
LRGEVTPCEVTEARGICGMSGNRHDGERHETAPPFRYARRLLVVALRGLGSFFGIFGETPKIACGTQALLGPRK